MLELVWLSPSGSVYVLIVNFWLFFLLALAELCELLVEQFLSLLERILKVEAKLEDLTYFVYEGLLSYNWTF